MQFIALLVSFFLLTAEASYAQQAPVSSNTATGAAQQQTIKNSPNSIAGYNYTGPSVLNYRDAIAGHFNVKAFMNKLQARTAAANGSRVYTDKVSLGNMGTVSGSGSSSSGGGNSSSGSTPPVPGTLGGGVTPPAVQGTAPPPVAAIAHPSKAIVSDLSGLLGNLAANGDTMSTDQVAQLINNEQQRTDLTGADRNYLDGLQSQITLTGNANGVLNTAKNVTRTIGGGVAVPAAPGGSVNTPPVPPAIPVVVPPVAPALTPAAAAKVLMADQNLNNPSQVSNLARVIICAQVAAGDPVAKAVEDQWTAQLGGAAGLKQFSSSSRQALINTIAQANGGSNSGPGNAATAAQKKYDTLYSWIESSTKQGQSYQQILASVQQNNPFLATQ